MHAKDTKTIISLRREYETYTAIDAKFKRRRIL